MSRALSAALRGDEPSIVTGLTWAPVEALAEFLGCDAHDPARLLLDFALLAQLDFVVVPAEESWAAKCVALLHEADVSVLWAVSGPLGRVAGRDGWVSTLRLSAAEPERLSELLAHAIEGVFADVDAGVAAHVDAFLLADDIAGAGGPLLQPEYALRALVPLYARVISRVAETGIPAVFHSDGDIRFLMPALAQAGFAGVHVAGVPGAAVAELHATAREQHFVVLGGIAAAGLAQGAEQRAELVGAEAARLALLGGTVVCDDGGFASASELASFLSALDVVRTLTATRDCS